MEVKWVESMSVNEGTIDIQHKNLLNQIDIINKILESDDINMGLLRESIHFLYSYIKEHLKYEEEYMISNNYPDFEKHKKIHLNFIEFYDGFQKEFREECKKNDFSSEDVKNLLAKIKTHLTDWWINHITTIDKKYAKYIEAHSK